MVFAVELLVAAKSGVNAADSVCSTSLQVRVGAFYARHARFLLRGSTAAAHCGVGGTRGSHCAAVAAVIAAWVAHAACGQRTSSMTLTRVVCSWFCCSLPPRTWTFPPCSCC
jgi:hypothetical protein